MPLAELIAIGSELLLGSRAETNSLFLSEALASAGIEVRFKSVVGDDQADIVNVIHTACRRARVVVMTGGLGPTSDDRTRQAVAQAIRRPLRRNAQALEGLSRRLAEWGRKPTSQLLRQSLIPSGAEVLPNPIGSAPGFCVMRKRCVLVALPGVPAEAQLMFEKEVLPRLAEQRALASVEGAIVPRLIHTFGLPESEVERRLQGLLPPRSRIHLGLQASPLGVTVSLTATRARSGNAQQKSRAVGDVTGAIREVRSRLGEYVYGEAAETMEGVVGQQLSARGLTLGVAESCTGGLIGHRITQVPGSSSYYERGVICYSNQSKQELLGVPGELLGRHGAVSAEVAAAMAAGIRVRSRAAIGLSVTGIAGPGGGTEQKPVGLVYIGLDWGTEPTGKLTREIRFHGDRQMVKLRASQAALNVLRLYLGELDERVRR